MNKITKAMSVLVGADHIELNECFAILAAVALMDRLPADHPAKVEMVARFGTQVLDGLASLTKEIETKPETKATT